MLCLNACIMMHACMNAVTAQTFYTKGSAIVHKLVGNFVLSQASLYFGVKGNLLLLAYPVNNGLLGIIVAALLAH